MESTIKFEGTTIQSSFGENVTVDYISAGVLRKTINRIDNDIARRDKEMKRYKWKKSIRKR